MMIEYLGKKMEVLGELHSHSVFSMHGFSSPTEMVEAARNQQYKYFAITDHINDYQDPAIAKNLVSRLKNMHRLNDYLEDISIMPGYEYDMFSPELSVRDKLDNYPHIKILGFHNGWHKNIDDISSQQYLAELANRLNDGYDIFAHPCRGISSLGDGILPINNTKLKEQTMLEAVRFSSNCGLLIEINTSSIRKSKSYIYYIKLIAEYAKSLRGCNVIVNSDAHVVYEVGMLKDGFDILEQVEFPVDRIVNFNEDIIKGLKTKILERAKALQYSYVIRSNSYIKEKGEDIYPLRFMFL